MTAALGDPSARRDCAGEGCGAGHSGCESPPPEACDRTNLISDVLADALGVIERCGEEYPETYGPLADRIAEAKAAMRSLRRELDGPPAVVPPAFVDAEDVLAPYGLSEEAEADALVAFVGHHGIVPILAAYLTRSGATDDFAEFMRDNFEHPPRETDHE